MSRTHWGQTVEGCGTLLCGGLWVCSPPGAPVIPVPGSADWVFSQAPAPLAWRSGLRADWLPKHTMRAAEQGWGQLNTFRICHKEWGCASIPVLHADFGMSKLICHTCEVSFVFLFISFSPSFCLSKLCWCTWGIAMQITFKLITHTQAGTHYTHLYHTH